MNDTLIYDSMPDDTRDHMREERTQMIKMGLMRYVARTPLYGEVEITPDRDVTRQEVADRWNNWVFELESRPSFEGEQSFKELSFRIFGGVARVNDQLSLKKEELSEADILLRLQELETSYEFDTSFGITYTFGSIYTNIVNPRFGNGRRFYY